MTGLLTRSYNVDYTKADPNWHTLEYSDVHWLLHPTFEFKNYYLRKNEFPYDWRDEHWLILKQDIDIDDTAFLWELVKQLNEKWYTVIFNSNERKSAKGLWHGHALK
jgi:hypothetical protein